MERNVSCKRSRGEKTVCLIQRRSSIGWWEEGGNPVYIFGSYTSIFLNTALKNINLCVGGGMRTSRCLSVPSGYRAFQLASFSSLPWESPLHFSLGAGFYFPFATIKDSVVSTITMFKPTYPLRYSSGLSSSKKPPLTFIHCWWECKFVQPLWKAGWRCLKNIETELPCDPAIPLLGICLKKTKTLILQGTCTPVFIAALFTIAKIRKQPKCPSTEEWIKKM